MVCKIHVYGQRLLHEARECSLLSDSSLRNMLSAKICAYKVRAFALGVVGGVAMMMAGRARRDLPLMSRVWM